MVLLAALIMLTSRDNMVRLKQSVSNLQYLHVYERYCQIKLYLTLLAAGTLLSLFIAQTVFYLQGVDNNIASLVSQNNVKRFRLLIIFYSGAFGMYFLLNIYYSTTVCCRRIMNSCSRRRME